MHKKTVDIPVKFNVSYKPGAGFEATVDTKSLETYVAGCHRNLFLRSADYYKKNGFGRDVRVVPETIILSTPEHKRGFVYSMETLDPLLHELEARIFDSLHRQYEIYEINSLLGEAVQVSNSKFSQAGTLDNFVETIIHHNRLPEESAQELTGRLTQFEKFNGLCKGIIP